MKIAYWEICPYLVGITPAHAPDNVAEYVRNNAGKAFEFMVADADKARKAAGLQESCMECWTARSEVCTALNDCYCRAQALVHYTACKCAP